MCQTAVDEVFVLHVYGALVKLLSQKGGLLGQSKSVSTNHLLVKSENNLSQIRAFQRE
jgi:hypothetical protein